MAYFTSTQEGGGRWPKSPVVGKHPRSGQHVSALQENVDDDVKDIWQCINTLRPRQNGRYFADDIFKCLLLNENTQISINISLEFVPEGRINNIPA